MTLTKKIRELTLTRFTGKIHVVRKANAQHIGVVFLDNGLLVNGTYQQNFGFKGLFHLVLADSKGDFRYLVEPEVIFEKDKKFKMKLDDFLKKIKDQYHDSNTRLRPPYNLKVLVRKEFTLRNEKTTPMEFNLLKVIRGHSRISDVYKHSNMLESVVTYLLISLRRKGALRVVEQ